MKSFLAFVVLVGLSIGRVQVAWAQPQSAVGATSALGSERTSTDFSTLPPAPKGRSTIIGGEIQNIDPVRDQITLEVLGQKPIKILFDERTEAYRDGMRISLRDLVPHDHASVETVLNATAVFALSIHMLTRPPQGEYQAKVLKYNPETGELTVIQALSRERIKLLVSRSTDIVREGQAEFSSVRSGPSDLVKGSLISLRFMPDKAGIGVATRIAIVASPGSSFVFQGKIDFLDLHAGLLTLVDSRDEASYQISFDLARIPTARELHLGEFVTTTSSFDGTLYVASAITIN
jgi:hypothetical protein